MQSKFNQPEGDMLESSSSAVSYVSYLEDGTLDGGYFQQIHPAHLNRYILVDFSVTQEWYLYQANAARDGVELIPPAPPQPMDEWAMWRAVQEETHRVACSFGYETILSAISFAGQSAVTRLQADGQLLAEWRAQMWDGTYDIIADARAESRTRPTSAAELLAELPAAPVPTPSAQIPQ